MRKLKLKDGAEIPALGLGTWYLGENRAKRAGELEALKYGIKNGMYLIDTAEMYGEGLSEELVGKAVKEFERNEIFVVSKVYPWNAGRKNIFTSCENSLKRLGLDYLDMYLLHWRGSVPLKETASCMEELVKRGKIRRWGVSNFDTDDMKELLSLKAGKNCCVNQVLYHLGSRGVEYDLLPYLKENDIRLMAYCPMAQGGSLKRGLLTDKNVKEAAARHNATPLQILLAFAINDKNVFAIPRSSKVEHVAENLSAADIKLTEEDIYLLNRSFPSPTRKTFLDMV